LLFRTHLLRPCPMRGQSFSHPNVHHATHHATHRPVPHPRPRTPNRCCAWLHRLLGMRRRSHKLARLMIHPPPPRWERTPQYNHRQYRPRPRPHGEGFARRRRPRSRPHVIVASLCDRRLHRHYHFLLQQDHIERRQLTTKQGLIPQFGVRGLDRLAN